MQKNANQCCFQKLPFFGEQSYDAWREKERERGAGGREARVQLEESSCWGGTGTGGDTGTAVVKMQKDKGWPDGCSGGGRPSVVVASGKL